MTPVLAALAGVLTAAALVGEAAAEPIPQDPLADPVPVYVGAPAIPERARAYRLPQHPFMAPNGRSNIHDDAYQTDSYLGPGPLGNAPEVLSTLQVAECASLTFDRFGRIVTVCVGGEGPRIMLLDAATLDELARMPLPPRTGGGGGPPLSDFSGGGYFYLDHLDRAVVPTNTRQIWIVGETTTPLGAPGFELVRSYRLQAPGRDRLRLQQQLRPRLARPRRHRLRRRARRVDADTRRPIAISRRSARHLRPPTVCRYTFSGDCPIARRAPSLS